jgi:4-amino-4-deoxy-L-arabinose transferase-like glycosyltransferase
MRPAPPQGSRGGGPRAALSEAPLSTRRFAAGLALLVAALAVLLLPNLGRAPIERAEIYFLDAARRMVETGDWLVPRYEGQPFFDKPILAYWLMAAAMDRLGTTPGAARLVPVAASIGTLLATAWLGTLLFGRRTGLVGGIVLATSFAFLGFAHLAMADMLLVAFTTAAVALGVRALEPGAPSWTVPALGAALGLGFATKGPIAILVPGLAALVLLWQKRKELRPVGRTAAALGVLAFVVLGLGWFGLVYRRLGTEPLVYFFLHENLERFAGETYDIGRPVWFYAPAYLAEGLPWSLLLPLAAWRLMREDREGRPRALFLVLWAGLVLVPLSLSRGKIDYYLLPLYPALALLVARYLVAVPWRGLDRAWARTVVLFAAAALAVLLVRPPRLPAGWVPGTGAERLLAAVLAAAAVSLVVVAIRPTAARVAAALSATVSTAWLVLVALFLPAFTAAQPNRRIAQDVARERRYQPDARMAVCSDPSRARREVLFETRIPVEETCRLWRLAVSPLPYLLLLTPEEHASFVTVPGYREVAKYRYVPARALTFASLFSAPEVGVMVLGANFETRDPIALRKKKRAYRQAMQRAFGGAPVRPRK